MTPEMVLDVGREAVWVMMLISGPLLLSALATGLFIGMIQAATQIQEMTLTFIPKLIVMAISLIVAGNWMIAVLTDFSTNLILSIPELIS
jgi:flagellar biosynthetic protein FliQ